MTPDYQAGMWVRRSRLLGWTLAVVMLLVLVLILGRKIAEVSEARAMQTTRAHLAASLTALAAEQMAKNQVPDAAWQKMNPFVLLSWQQDNYCGELAAGDEPQAGCWYWLPQQAWVLYRQRFADGWAQRRNEVHAWRVLAIPDGASTAPQWTSQSFALELAAVPAAELLVLGFE